MSQKNFLDPVLAPIPQALKIGGFGRSTLYGLLGSGRIKAVKVGARTLIDLQSLHTFLEALPPAPIGKKAPRSKKINSSRI